MGREIYAEYLRIIAAFAVVFQHTVTSVWYTTAVHTSEFWALNFFNSLSRFGVGIFFMISGAFMLSPAYPHSPRKILTHNLPKILILLAFWVVLYGIVSALCGGQGFYGIIKAPLTIFLKPYGHLWFLYVIAGLYILTPALRIFTEHASQKMQLYTIAVLFTFGLLLPSATLLIEKTVHITLYKHIGIQGTTSFLAFYLAGFYITHFGLKPTHQKILYVLAILSWIVALAGASYFSLWNSKPDEFFFGNFRPTTFLMAAGIFCLIREKYRGITINRGAILKISQCMLGVYLIHPLFIKAFYGLKFSILSPHPIIMAPLMALVFFGLSLLAVYLLRFIPGLRKLL